MSPTTFQEVWTEADGAHARVRVVEAGHGHPLVVLPGSDGLHLSRAHELLSQSFRVVSLDLPGIGERSASDLAELAGRAMAELGLEQANLLASDVGAPIALQLASQGAERIRALVLESPSGLLDVDRPDAALEEQLRRLPVPTLVLFGTRDRVSPPGMGRRYRELMPRCHFILVYDTAHTIARDRPEAFADTVGDYLERLEAFVVQRESGLLHP